MPTSTHLQELARRGAEARLRELQGEIASIHQMFPDLKDVVRPQAAAQSTDEDSTQQASAAGTESESAPRRRRRKRGWSPAQRKAAAERMKAYWAKRKRA